VKRVISRLAIFLAFLLLPRLAAALEIQNIPNDAGIELWLVEDHANPIISVAFGVKGGTAYDPPGKEGLAELASGLFDEGAGELDSAAFQKQLNDRGIDFRFSAGQDDFTGDLRFLSQDREVAANLLSLALTQPRFDAEPLERIRNGLLIEIAQGAGDPGYIAGRNLDQMLLDGHPYGRPGNGTTESVSKLTAADLKDFVARRFVRARLHVAIVGDIDATAARAWAQQAFGKLPETADLPDLPPLTPSAKGGARVVDFAAPQATILFAQPGITRSDPDFFAAYLANYSLGGGGFSSRLMTEVREKRGLVYGIGSDLWTMDAGGLIAGQFETDPDKVVEAIRIVRAEWARMAAEGPSAEELENARTYLIGYYPRNFTSTMKTAQALRGLQLEALGIDYVERRQKEIAAVTAADVRRVAARLLDAAQLSFIVVGPAAQIPLDGAEVVKPAAQN
jgi:zinc protease